MTRLPRERRRRIRREIPPRRCSAHSSRTGEPCRQWAMVGGSTCQAHGSMAPAARQAILRRVSLAEALATGDRRHPSEVLDDALRVVDVAGQQLIAAIASGSVTVTPETVTALVEAAKQQAVLAKVVLDAGGGQQWSAREALRAQGAVLAEVLRALAELLGHDPQDPAVKARVSEAIRVGASGGRARLAPLRPAVEAVERPAVRPQPTVAVDAEVVEGLTEPLNGLSVPDDIAQLRTTTKLTRPAKALGQAVPARGRHRDPEVELGPFGDRGWSP